MKHPCGRALCVFSVLGLPGCEGPTKSRLSYPSESKGRLSLVAVRSNDPGLSYGLRGLEDGRIGNEVFALTCRYFPGGFLLVLENFTESPLFVNWEACALVDDEGWTHSILHPELAEESSAQSHIRVIVAPYAKRWVPLVARCLAPHQFNRPATETIFHPRSNKSGKMAFSQRILLSIQFRDEELFYDFTLRYEPKSST